MKTRVSLGVVVLLILLSVIPGQAQGPEVQAPLGTGFTYQGQLRQSGSPVSGTCDFQFSLWNALTAGTQIGATQGKALVAVTRGLFTVLLDFGGAAFKGDALWLEVKVRCPAGSGTYTTLTPRQALTPAPYALALRGLWTEPNDTSPNVIGGYSGNSVTAGAHGATIAGGGETGNVNRVTDDYGVVAGGRRNQAGDDAGTTSDRWFATVGGGWQNTASGVGSTISGGVSNTASGYLATVGGGYGHTPSGSFATIGGGYGHTASGQNATVGGGTENTASGYSATIPGGGHNIAQGEYSFAAGRRARANVAGCFVWGDNTDTEVICNDNNRWLARASGGVYFYTNSSLTSGMYLAAGGSAWNAVSDHSLKENFVAVDGREVLARLANIPITTWNYKSQDAAIRHIGLMAQDFNSLMEGLGGEGANYINTLDADGVALAAIQGLYERSQTLETENAALRQQVTDLEYRMAALEALVAQMAKK